MMSDMGNDAEPGMTIECRQLVELVTDYLEGVLDDATRAELEAHLQLCEACAEYVHQMQVTLQMVGAVPLDCLSDETRSGLLDAFRGFRGAAG
jgi:anti-sigma factor RsiW